MERHCHVTDKVYQSVMVWTGMTSWQFVVVYDSSDGLPLKPQYMAIHYLSFDQGKIIRVAVAWFFFLIIINKSLGSSAFNPL